MRLLLHFTSIVQVHFITYTSGPTAVEYVHCQKVVEESGRLSDSSRLLPLHLAHLRPSGLLVKQHRCQSHWNGVSHSVIAIDGFR